MFLSSWLRIFITELDVHSLLVTLTRSHPLYRSGNAVNECLRFLFVLYLVGTPKPREPVTRTDPPLVNQSNILCSVLVGAFQCVLVTLERALEYADGEGRSGVGGKPEPEVWVRLGNLLQFLLQVPQESYQQMAVLVHEPVAPRYGRLKQAECCL